jgi:hypothetical protein
LVARGLELLLDRLREGVGLGVEESGVDPVSVSAVGGAHLEVTLVVVQGKAVPDPEAWR